jgi:hypothetical protein
VSRQVDRILAILLAVFALARAPAGGQSSPLPEPARALRVLFVGNSLTYVNDLPEIVAAMAAAAGEVPPVCRAVVGPGFSLEDHWNQGEASRTIAKQPWDFVILQQGPSASADGRALLLRFARKFADAIRRAGAKPSLYMVWPAEARRQDFGGVADAYRLAARDIGAALFPAGEAWRIAAKTVPSVGLYARDGMHPSAAGSYVAGTVIFAGLYGRPPTGLPARLALPSGEIVEVPPEAARPLQEAAARAVEEFGLAAK